MSKERAYYLISPAGNPNLGDEYILRCWIDTIRAADAEAVILCDVLNPDIAGEVIAPAVPRVRFVSYFWRLLWDLDGDSLPAGEGGGLEALDAGSRASLYADLLRGLAESYDIASFHFLGGGYFNAEWPRNYALIQIARELAARSGAKLVMTGQSFVPEDPERLRSLAGALGAFDVVDVRDEQSFALLRPYLDTGRLTQSGDDALLYFDDTLFPAPPLRPLPGRRLILCLQRDLFPADDVMAELLSEQAVGFLREACRIEGIVLVQAMPSDMTEVPAPVADRLERHGLRPEICGILDVMEKGIPICADGVAVTTRYHLHLFHAMAGARGVALQATPYYLAKHQSVRDMGSNWPILSRDSLRQGCWERALRKVAEGGFAPLGRRSPKEMAGRKRQVVRRLQERGVYASARRPILGGLNRFLRKINR